MALSKIALFFSDFYRESLRLLEVHGFPTHDAIHLTTDVMDSLCWMHEEGPEIDAGVQATLNWIWPFFYEIVLIEKRLQDKEITAQEAKKKTSVILANYSAECKKRREKKALSKLTEKILADPLKIVASVFGIPPNMIGGSDTNVGVSKTVYKNRVVAKKFKGHCDCCDADLYEDKEGFTKCTTPECNGNVFMTKNQEEVDLAPTN
jgi:hypothetical protein